MNDSTINNESDDSQDLQYSSPNQFLNQQENLPKKRKKFFFIVTVIIMLGLSTTGVIYFLTKDQKQAQTSHSQPSINDQQISKAVVVTPIPSPLYQESKNVNGVAIGYIKVNNKSSGFRLLPRVYAEGENEYNTALFFSSGDSIYMMNTETGSKEAVNEKTDVNCNNQVFSSVSQTLAYECSGRITIKSLASKSDAKKIEDSFGNAIPITWSQDGKKLFVIVMTSAAPGTEEYTKSKIAVYNLNTNKLESIAMPTGYGTMANIQNVAWTSEKDLMIELAEKTKFGEFTKQSWFSIDTENNITNPITVPYDNLASVRKVGDEVYYIKNSKLVVSKQGEETSIKEVPNTDSIGQDYLVQMDTQSQNANAIVMSTGMPGSLDSFTFNKLNLNSNNKDEIFKPTGYSNVLLGWTKDYGAIIYYSFLSTHSEIRMFNITTKTDSLIASDVELN